MTKLPFKIQERKIYYGTDVGHNNTYMLKVPNYKEYKVFDGIKFISNSTNTGPSELRINDLEVVPIKKFIFHNLDKCDIIYNHEVYLVYMKDHFMLLDVTPQYDGLKKAA